MKQDIHPKYDKTTVTCTCGNTFDTKSTVDTINVEICSACHPFYTGKQKLVDTAGRVDRFKMRLEATATKKASKAPKKDKVAPETKPKENITLADIKEEFKEELVEETKDSKNQPES